MIPDPQAMISLANKIEQAAHHTGWDEPPALGYVMRFDGGYRLIEAPVQPQQLASNTTAGLVELSKRLFRSTDKQRQALKDNPPLGSVAPDVAGVVFAFGAWYTDVPIAMRGGKRIADTAEAKEIRVVILLDCGGRLYRVDRVRGGKAVATMYGPHHKGAERTSGPVIESLRRILLAVGANMPDGTIDMEAVGAVAD